jgi:AraC family transcriptional regulator, transcriptional activator of pobA
LENSRPDTYAAFQIEREALKPRVIRRRFSDRYSTLLLLEQGALHFDEHDEKNVEIIGPAMCFWPQGQFPNITLAPGSSAKVLGISDELSLDAVGAQAESVHLRMMIEQPFQVALQVDPRVPHVESLFDWLRFETGVPQLRSQMMVSAYLRCLLMIAVRIHAPSAEDSLSKRAEILRRFRHLVELHYRDHWKITDYAAHLGVEYDRLHRICKRHTDRTPAELVNERMISEAKARLEQTGHSVKKIAATLGFADGSRFSHFFKRRTSMSPGAYRAVISKVENENLEDLRRGFSDWP